MSPLRAAIGSRRRATIVFAEPSTITGSIGVFGILPSFEGTLAKLGLGADGVKTTPLSGEPDLLHGPQPGSRPADPGRRRTESIATSWASSPQARHKSPAEIDRIAQGRVWDGGTARQLGLVDGFGGMDEAIAKAAELAKLGDERGVRYLERPTSFTEQAAGHAGRRRGDRRRRRPMRWRRLPPAPEWRLRAALAGTSRRSCPGPSIQVRCLECPPVAPVGGEAQTDAGCVRRRCWGLAEPLIRLAAAADAAAVAAIVRDRSSPIRSSASRKPRRPLRKWRGAWPATARAPLPGAAAIA